MLIKPSLEELLTKVGSRYTLTILTAKRARQLANGGLPLTNSDNANYVTNACEEIKNSRVFSVKGSVDVSVPLRPEVLAERLAAKAEEENALLKEAIEDTFSKKPVLDSSEKEDKEDSSREDSSDSEQYDENEEAKETNEETEIETEDEKTEEE